MIKLDDGGYKLELKIDTARERISEESFNFKCSLNLSSIAEKQEKAKPQTRETETERKNFSRQQQKLYNFLKRRSKDGQREFAKSELREIVPLGNNALNSAINRLNKQYQEIYSTEEKLIEFNRREEKVCFKQKLEL